MGTRPAGSKIGFSWHERALRRVGKTREAGAGDAMDSGCSARSCAFTLVEMIVVVGIVLLLLALIVPATVTLLRGSQLTQGGDLLMAQLDLARQAALSRNRPVQVRLCRPTGGQYTAIMPLYVAITMSATGNVTQTYTAVSKPVTLPTAVIMDAGATLSTILNQTGIAATTASTTDPRLGSLGTGYQYVAFQFKADGSTDLLSQTSPSTSGTTNLWFLTVHNQTDGDSLGTAPPNYYTIQLDAYNGHVRPFRP